MLVERMDDVGSFLLQNSTYRVIRVVSPRCPPGQADLSERSVASNLSVVARVTQDSMPVRL